MSRVLTIFAVGLLALDGILLLLIGVWKRHAGFVAAGIGLLAGAGLVVLAWRRHRRQIADIHEARQDLHRALETMRKALNREDSGLGTPD
jgi:Flp pilus assembly protein TadB